MAEAVAGAVVEVVEVVGGERGGGGEVPYNETVLFEVWVD